MVLVQVLSPSTEDYDRGEKLGNYKLIPSLEEIMPVAHDRRDGGRPDLGLSRAPAGDTPPAAVASKAITPEEARALIQQGAIYVDVRSEVEFEAGHPEGALNVPISHKGPAGMVPNQDFLAVMQAAFAESEVLILGCKSGPRSNRAAEILVRAGFTHVSTMPAGFHGSRDAFGRPLPGWAQAGLPVGQGAPSGQSYPDVKGRKPGG